MLKESIVYKNRIEVKILLIVYIVVFVPASIALISAVIKTKDYPLLSLFLFMILFIIILLIINRFKIVFDYENEIIKYTWYFSKTKTYLFKDVSVKLKKSGTTIPNDYDYIFVKGNNKLFKISSIDFEGQTKKSVDCLDLLLEGEQRIICSLKKLNIKDGYIGFYTYDLSEQIATIYLPNDYSIEIGYDNVASCYKLVLLKTDNTILDRAEIYDSNILFSSVQTMLDKYQ